MSASTAETIDNLEAAETATETAVVVPPGDLLSDEPEMESEFHLRQMILLIQCLEFWWRDRQDFYACGNMTIYYSPRQRKSEFFRGPDFFVVLGTERKPRKSWVLWDEDGKYPNVIIEILSDSTAETDRGLKKQIYQDTFRTPEYFWFDPATHEFCGFQLVGGFYQPLQPTDQGWLWSQQLELFLGIQQSQLRLFTPEGDLIPTPEEAAAQAEQRAGTAEQRAIEAEQRAEQLAAQLRQLGIEPADA